MWAVEDMLRRANAAVDAITQTDFSDITL